MSFSSDARLVAVGRSDPMPHVYKLDTFERVMPWQGHSGRISHVYFTAQENRIRSYGFDGTVCLWDATTMAMLERICLPADHRVVSVRKPHGRYAFCYPIPRKSLSR